MKIYDARQDPGRQHRRVASERHLLRRRQLRVGPDRRQGGRRICQGLGKCGEVTIFNGDQPRRGRRRRTSAWPASPTASRRSAARLPAERIADGDLRRRHHRAGADQDDRLADGASRGRAFVLGTSIDDARSAGISKALAQNGRDGCSGRPRLRRHRRRGDQGRATRRRPSSSAASPTSRRRYPDYVMSIGLDVLEGKPVPNEVHIEHVFLDKDDRSVYPERRTP